MKRYISILILIPWFTLAQSNVKELYDSFIKEYGTLRIPETQLAYNENFSHIQNNNELEKQEQFFNSYKSKLAKVKQDKEGSIVFGHLNYIITENLERILLEKKWNNSDKQIPTNGLHSLPLYKEWYSYYVKHFTGVKITPEEVFKVGEQEVKKAQVAISKIRIKLGYKSEEEFYKYLNGDQFFLTSKPEIINGFKKIDSVVRKNLTRIFTDSNVPKIEPMEWPNGTSYTPPGIYLSQQNNPYGVDVFQFNFATGKYNKRCMQWLYMHEAIPGHHLQSTSRAEADFFYFGTAEGWACYVEDMGKDVGLYNDNYSELGKEEWNLVRSARLVMEVGIHYYGWSYDKAMEYWKQNIKNQDTIAEREIKRITNWPGQALCYKIGALTIQKIVANKKAQGFSLKQSHQFILENSNVPLQVLL